MKTINAYIVCSLLIYNRKKRVILSKKNYHLDFLGFCPKKIKIWCLKNDMSKYLAKKWSSTRE